MSGPIRVNKVKKHCTFFFSKYSMKNLMSFKDLQRESSCSCNRLHEYVTVDVSEVVSHDIHFRYCCHSFPFIKGGTVYPVLKEIRQEAAFNPVETPNSSHHGCHSHIRKLPRQQQWIQGSKLPTSHKKKKAVLTHWLSLHLAARLHLLQSHILKTDLWNLLVFTLLQDRAALGSAGNEDDWAPCKNRYSKR